MSLVWLLLAGCASCSGLPDSIPEHKGKVDEATAPDLLTVSSPDLVVIPWDTLYELSIEDYRGCPLIYVTDSQIYVDAGGDEGCHDSVGVFWKGTATVSYSSSAFNLDFNDFGPVDGVTSPWSALGSIRLTPTTSGSAMVTDSRLAVTSYGPGGKLELWHESTASFLFYGGVFYADHLNGTVGLEDWGTASVEELRIPLSLVNGCPFGEHAAGTVALTAQNDAIFSFQLAADAAAGPPPPPTNGDTGDTGRGTGGTGSTSGTPDSGQSLPNPTGGTGQYCGQCVQLTLDGQAVSGCVEPTRTISWPFVPPF